jgi:DNA-binding response OmpR family regulator
VSAEGPRILVVDDEAQIVRGLKIILRTAGYSVEAASTKSEALASLGARPPAALVLDLVLPDGQGVEVCREVRRWSRLPILVLSAVGDEREKVRALDAGADDYVTKPFGTEEFLARLRAILRRSAETGASPLLELGEVTVDLSDRRVTRAGPTSTSPRSSSTSCACSPSTAGASSPTASSCTRCGGPSTARRPTTSGSTSPTSAPSSRTIPTARAGS